MPVVPSQAQYAIPDLPAGTTVVGVEQVEAIQNGVSVRLTTAQIAALGGGGGGGVPTIRLPVFASTINILASDIEVGVNTSAGPVTVNLPSALTWSSTRSLGLDLTILDASGLAATNNVTFVLNGGDIVLQMPTLPPLTQNYASLRLRPFGTVSVVGWYIRGIG
jgi:hypothetical protein